jgi:hypothetical protein
MEKSVKIINDTKAGSNGADVAEIVKENKSATPEVKAAATNAEPEKTKKRTLGNKIYDFGVFGSIAWLGVSAMSAITAREAMHGNNPRFSWLRALNNSVFKNVSNFLSKTAMKNSSKESIDAVANNVTMTAILGTGGSTLMAPIKWLEDHRESNAAKIDKLLGTTPPDEDTVAKEPKQSWKSVLSGRMLSWAMALTAVLAPGPKIVSKVNNFFGEKGAEAWMKLKPKIRTEPQVKSVKQWANLISFDLIFSTVTAAVTYGFSRFIAKKHDVGGNLYELNPIAPNPFGEEGQHNENTKSFAQKIEPKQKISPQPSGKFIDKINNENNLGHALM